ncbi:MAG: ABC transporter permease subunit [Paenibacillus macerans]|uniref:Binding--dependent transport system inner membrane component family protein n=1 Tax=Paenibacillus macerans TaxID=44252 RepID=A0A090ZLS4_PAEMA|nr:ABC transporter permease subunit [Paenibacillus macerans]KFN12339.1 binding--dependent transport system inner membrane component family protein [Paenibacillus macerans]MCY7558294.1 ABC transporter permease subunit [Paenibacillus macerans]MDU5946490.1 ABC transporter permease subunit [Paenibacillus macerans]MDU7474644.1 ABC transporter permease subunit [Paenibacillus macerans]MEC0137815.1 ABC transporter permease subunit [Paenibacillus macerans]
MRLNPSKMNASSSGARLIQSGDMRLAGAALVFLLLLGTAGALAPWIVPNDPDLVALAVQFSPPSWEYPFGTDHLGRCILSRLLMAIRYSLGGAVAVMVCSVVTGTVTGAFFAWKGGLLDRLFMRCCDLLLAFPTLVLAFALVGVMGPGFVNLLLALIFSQWIAYARFVRSLVLSLKTGDYVRAAIVSGTTGWKLVRRHLIPQVAIPVAVLQFLETGGVVLDMTGLTFLGLGVQAPEAEWGMMLNESKSYIWQYPWLMVYPGIAILLTVIAFNLIGDGLRAWFDPRGR